MKEFTKVTEIMLNLFILLLAIGFFLALAYFLCCATVPASVRTGELLD